MQSYGSTDYVEPIVSVVQPHGHVVPATTSQYGYQNQWDVTNSASNIGLCWDSNTHINGDNDALLASDVDVTYAASRAIPVIQIQGYSNVSLENAPLDPPSGDETDARTDQANLPEIRQPPSLLEGDIRELFVSYCNEQCCYGTDAARNMVILNSKSSSAYHYSLESFGEKRSTVWAFEPYTGGEVDGVQNGVAPGPWDIPLFPKEKFKEEKITTQVPHTAYVKSCHKCLSHGHLKCHHCTGSGGRHCFPCDGHGQKKIGHTLESCPYCNGRGRESCVWCHGQGRVKCSICNGYGQVKWFIKLTVVWKNHADDFILEQSSLPEQFIRRAHGQVVFEDERPWVFPINQCPESQINRASADLVTKHRQHFITERVHLQRHSLRVVPVTEVTAVWNQKNFSFIIYDFDCKVYTKNYPQSCCCCCAII